MKHNLEREVENMEIEIVKLRAQLEGDSDMEKTKMSTEENVAEDKTWCENMLSVVAVSQDTLSDLSQKSACQRKEKTDFLQEQLLYAVDRDASQTESLTLKPSCIVSDVPLADSNIKSYISFSKADECAVSDQSAQLLTHRKGAVSNSVKEELATLNGEDWPELSANTLKMGVRLPHVTSDRQFVVEQTLTGCMSVMNDDGDGTTCSSKEGPADISVDAVTHAVESSVGDNDCEVSAVPLVSVIGDELTENTSCIQLEYDTVSAIPDSLDRISAACDAADDTNSCVSCEDIVVPDSEDDLFCSPHNGLIDLTALTSYHDKSHDVNKIVTVSDLSGDVPSQCDTVDGFAVLVNISRAQAESSVDSLAENVKQEPQKSKEKYISDSDDSVSQCNRVLSQTHRVCMSDADNTAIIKHADSLTEDSHLSSIDQTFDAAVELHQPSAPVQEQFPKRPHWTLVVSGISPVFDQVILPSVYSRLQYFHCTAHSVPSHFCLFVVCS